VSYRLSLWILIISIIAIPIIASSMWNIRIAIFMFFTALMGVVIGQLLSKSKELKVSNLVQKRESKKEESKRKEENFASTEELFETIMNGMREGVLVIDQNMRVVAANHAAQDIFKHIKGPLNNHLLIELTRHPDIHSAFQLAITNKERSDVKVELNSYDHPIFDLRVVPLPLSHDRSVSGAIGVFFNITQLERLERVRQEFFTNVSHELRTPLTAIIAFVETLEDGAIDDGDNNRRFLSVIRKNATRMQNLIEDILELSAIESGTVSVKPIHIELRPIVQDVITALTTKADARQVSLRNEITSGIMVYADARRLEQILTNLIDNAIKFNTPNGQVTISHRLEEADCICVTDTGDGIAPEHAERIFERFYRVDRARSREMGGTGLGLAIVKHLVRAHGGDAKVESSHGKGSTFTIYLPHVVEVYQAEINRSELTLN
jgi:two-component system, OmpR family, phosphate regulon sensor histidine kinase PhoR